MKRGAITNDMIRQAAEWAAQLDGGAAAADRAACDAWCRQDPRHRLVLERMRGLDASMAVLDGAQRQVLRRAFTTRPRRSRRLVATLLGAALAGGLLLCLGGVWL